MHTTGMSFKAIGRQMGYHYTVVSRLVRKHTQTNNVKDLSISGRPRVTFHRDDRALQRDFFQSILDSTMSKVFILSQVQIPPIYLDEQKHI